MSKIVKEYMGTLDGKIEGQMLSGTPPDNPEVIKYYALEFMEKYKDLMKIYTDGSKTEKGRVGSAYYIPELKREKLRITYLSYYCYF